MPRPMKYCCCNDENRRVDEQREHERKCGVDCRKFDRLPPAARRLLELACLHNGGVQIQIMRHYRRPQNANADVQHSLICDDSRARDESAKNASHAGLREDNLRSETTADDRNQSNDDRLDVTKTFGLQI